MANSKENTLSRATDRVLDELHGLLAASQAEELQRNLERSRLPRTIPGEDGKPVPNPDYEPLSPKLLAVIRAFLKDNGIDAPASAPRFDGLIRELQTINVDDLPAV